MKKVVKVEVMKLLDATIIYPISESAWPVQVVQKKGEMAMVTNEKNELIPTRTIIGWRVCIDYMKLNDTTKKDHLPLPFELCNVLATFQRCMLAIFEDLVEDTMEVFMDAFLVFGDSFDICLKNLEWVLVRCEETNLVLSSN